MRGHGQALIKQHGLDGNFQVLDLGRLARLHQVCPLIPPHPRVLRNPCTHAGPMHTHEYIPCGLAVATALRHTTRYARCYDGGRCVELYLQRRPCQRHKCRMIMQTAADCRRLWKPCRGFSLSML